MWKCNHCGEQVEDNFGTCWNCQSDREGGSAQSLTLPNDTESINTSTAGETVAPTNAKFFSSSEDYYTKQYTEAHLAALESGQAPCDKCGVIYNLSEMIGREWRAADRKMSAGASVPGVSYELITRYVPVEPPLIISVWLCKSCIRKNKNFRAILVASIITLVLIISGLLIVALFYSDMSNPPGVVMTILIIFSLVFAGILILVWVIAIRVLKTPILNNTGEIIFTLGAAPLLTLSHIIEPHCRAKLKATGHDYGYAISAGENVMRSFWWS